MTPLVGSPTACSARATARATEPHQVQIVCCVRQRVPLANARCSSSEAQQARSTNRLSGPCGTKTIPGERVAPERVATLTGAACTQSTVHTIDTALNSPAPHHL